MQGILRQTGSGRVVRDPQPEMARTVDSRVKHIALVLVAKDASQVPQSRIDEIEQYARESEHYYDSIDVNGHWHPVECRVYVVESEQIGLTSFNWSLVKDQMDAQHPDFTPTYFVGIGGHKPGINGVAWINSGKAWIYLSGGLRTIIHEILHCFGLGHAGTQDSEYGGGIMGKGWWGPNAIHRSLLGLMSAIDEGEGEHFLVPVEVPETDLRAGETQAVRISHGTKRYVLSTHKTATQHRSGVRWESQIYVHSPVGHLWDSTYTHLITHISEGSQVDLGGLVVSHGGTKDGVIRALVNAQPEKAFPEPEIQPGIQIGAFVNTIWHDPRYGHQGLVLYRTGLDTLHGYYFTHSVRGPVKRSTIEPASNGREWFLIDGKIRPSHVEVKIFKSDGQQMQPVGYGTLSFADELNGLFQYHIDDFGRDHLKIEPIAPPRENPGGVWESGHLEGYAVSTHHGEPHIYWFGHNDWNLHSNGSKYVANHRYKERPRGDMERIGDSDFSTDGLVRVI